MRIINRQLNTARLWRHAYNRPSSRVSSEENSKKIALEALTKIGKERDLSTTIIGALIAASLGTAGYFFNLDLVKIDNSIVRIDNSITRLDNSIVELNKKNEELDRRVTKVDKRIRKEVKLINDKIDGIETKIDTLTKMVEESQKKKPSWWSF